MAKISTVLFDLDGTLLPMDQDAFTKGYFKLLASALAPHGYDPQQLIADVWAGTKAMMVNDGSCTNEQAFWKKFSSIYGEKAELDKPLFDAFYREGFQQVKQFCGYNPLAAETVRKIKAMGCRAALATNPLFPSTATESRIRWAGLEPEEFELYTTYENSSCCKPNPEYYREILAQLGCAPEETLMVGNDVKEDLIAETLGMRVFLLTDCVLNRDGADVSGYPQGGFEQLLDYIEECNHH